jgi:hypothetical protein
MKLAKGFSLFTVAVLLVAGVANSAMASAAPERVGGYAGHIYVNAVTGKSRFVPGGPGTAIVGDVYDNTTAASNFGFSSTDLASIFGDRVTTTGTGIVQQTDFSIFNSGASAGPLLTATFNISYANGASNVGLGSFTTGSVTFGAGLDPGFFTVVTVTGLSGLNILLNTTDIVIRQQVATKTGTATRLGIVSLDPPTAGASANTMFIQSSTVGVAGYYTIGNPPNNANPAYRINVGAPVGVETKSWGAVKAVFN